MIHKADAEPTKEATPKGPRAHPDSGLNEKQTEALHQVLVDRQTRLIQERQEHLDTARFTTERVAEAEEAAAQDSTQSTLMGLAENERKLLMQIDRALRKMEHGTYGVSEVSGEPIGFDRLKAVPFAALSAQDQEQLERDARGRGR